MSRKETWQKMLKEERLPHQLSVQSRQIEKVFMQRQLPTQVAGGTVTRQHVQFDIQTQLASGWEKLRGLKQEFLSALGVADIQFVREEGQLKLRVEQPEVPPVALVELLPILPDLAPITAALGLSEDGRPVLLELVDQNLAHVLISGTSGAGKTALLRTIATSLAFSNKQSQLQLLIIDADADERKPDSSQLDPLTHLPHLLEPVLSDYPSAIDALQFVVNEVTYRLEQQVMTPTIVVMIDNVVALLKAGGQLVEDALILLAQKGVDAGVHLVLSTRQAESEKLSSLLRATIPVRLIGYEERVEGGQIAADSLEIRPDYLYGEGDFIAVVGGNVTYFQAAYVGDYDLHLMLDSLNRMRPRPLLAHSFEGELKLKHEKDEKEREAVVHFSRTRDDDVAIFAVDEDDELDEIPFDAGDGWPKMN